MTIRRTTEEVNDEHGRHATAVEERQTYDTTAHDAVAEDEVVSTGAGGWNFARGWMRVFAALLGVALATVETFIGLRLAFLLGEANAANGFVNFIYDVSDPLVEPFQGIFTNDGLSGGGIFEPASVIAMAVYFVAAALLIAVILIATTGPSPSGERVVTSRSRHRQSTAHDH
ncbi:MAG TPA: hypothetical protein VGR43_08980 [Dehalococcoidia bacterium]|jgi:hypothetical protein|nr:hypothetical protein [Dehalococcoidia bacterium]